jgi:hypothetical protein
VKLKNGGALFEVTKIQVQVPDRLFEKIKKFARQHQLFLAETFRCGAESLLETYSEHALPQASSTAFDTLRHHEERTTCSPR